MTSEDDIDAFWSDADPSRPADLHARLDALLEGLPADDPVALFERASLRDFLDDEAGAIELYRAALAAGLPQPRRTRATIQLASSLRNVGQPSAAIALLQAVPDDDPLVAPARAFLALALLDDTKAGPAVRTALTALAPTLPEYGGAIARYAGTASSPARVRNVVVALIVRDGHVLAEEYPASGARGPFLRAPGGGLEFGETVEAGIRREIAEELDADLDEATLLAVVENIFVHDGKRGHEIVHVFGARSVRLEALPVGERLPVLDSDTTVGWYDLADLGDDGIPFYPVESLELARGLAARGGAEVTSAGPAGRV